MKLEFPLFTLPLVLLLLVVQCQSQTAGGGSQREQSSFGTEEVPGIPLVKRPVPVPNAALQILNEDVDVKGCLSDTPLLPSDSFTSLFIGSDIHLDGHSESDLIVVPVPDSGCFHSATGISVFWVFRGTGEQYELVLKALGNGLGILKTKYNGYRIIETGIIRQAGRKYTTATFRFDGKHYQKYQEKTQNRQ
jgi:hypothetical protein